jgi:D-serine deaminase-like pyridoxal phosphate-dependent protein
MISWKCTCHIFAVNVKYEIKTIFRTADEEGRGDNRRKLLDTQKASSYLPVIKKRASLRPSDTLQEETMNEQQMPVTGLTTPSVIIYLDILEANIAEMARLAREAGVRLRPHTKIHECPEIARMQISGGACGIEVGAIERALCMAEAGIGDILIAHPFYGDHKLAILRRLLGKPGLRITVMVDMVEQAEGISRTGEGLGRTIPVLMKINTGGDRFGVLPGEPALNLARQICRLPGIAFEGLYAHESGGKPTPESLESVALETATLTAKTAKLLAQAGIPANHVSVGASPTLRAACSLLKGGRFPEITEIHPGHCAIGDIWHVRALANPRDACAAAVLCSVMSAADPRQVIIDAGYKTFGADSLIQYRDQPGFFREGRPSYGSVQGRPDLWLGKISAETAAVQYTDPDMAPKKRLRLGDRLEIIPNNATLAISMQERIYGVRNDMVERVFAVAMPAGAYLAEQVPADAYAYPK